MESLRPKDTGRQLLIPSVLNELLGTVERLTEKTTNISKRLEPIMAAIVPMPCSVAQIGKPEVDTRPPHVRCLAEINERLSVMDNLLGSMLDRLEM